MLFAAGYSYDFNLPTAAPAPAPVVAAAVLRFTCSQLLIEFFFFVLPLSRTFSIFEILIT